MQSWVDGTSGVENPRYRTQIRDLQNATTDFVGYERKIVVHSYPHVRVDWVGANDKKYYVQAAGFSSAYGPSFSSVATSTLDMSKARSAALGRFYSSARSAQTALQGGVVLGELRETLSLLRGRSQILHSLTSRTLGKFSGIARSSRTRRGAMKEISGSYLEYAFGIAPLISDVKGAIEAYERLRGKQVSLRCRGFGEESKQVQSGTDVVNIYDSNANFVVNKLEFTRAQVIYYGAVKASVHATSGQSALKTLGFTPSEFLPTVWELLPWSFLVDYFTNIGEIVGAASFVDSDIAWVSMTTRAEAVVKHSGSYNQKVSGVPLLYNPNGSGSFSWESTKKWVTRSRNASLGVPTLRFELPGSPMKYVNMAALLAQSRTISSIISKLL